MSAFRIRTRIAEFRKVGLVRFVEVAHYASVIWANKSLANQWSVLPPSKSLGLRHGSVLLGIRASILSALETTAALLLRVGGSYIRREANNEHGNGNTTLAFEAT